MTKKERLRLWRELRRRGISHAEIARAAGVSRSMVTKVLSGAAVSLPVVEVIRRYVTSISIRGR